MNCCYLRRWLASGRYCDAQRLCVCVCVRRAALVSAAKVMRCIQWSLAVVVIVVADSCFW